MLTIGFTRLTGFIFIVLVFSTFQSRAEMFKWVDENGKVHYSDKKPDEETKTRVVPVRKGVSNESAGNEILSKAIIRPYERTARKLFLLDTLYAWRKQSESNKNRKVGAFYVGKGCTSRGAMKVPDVFLTHKSFFPQESANAYSIKKIIQSLDYEADKTTKYKLLNNLKKTGGLSLHSEIVDLSFDTCASSLSKRERLTKINKISSYKFNRHRIKLDIHWKLKTNRDQDVLYEVTTTGNYNGWNSVASAGEAFTAAVESATIKLFSDKAFIENILVEEDAVNLESVNKPSSMPVKFSGAASIYDLYISVNDQDWVNKLRPNDTVGSLYFGDRCAAKKNFSMEQASISHAWLFSSKSQPVHAVIKRIQSLGYSIKPAVGDMQASIHNTGGYSLQAELIDVAYESCAPSLSAASKYMAFDKISGRKFNRNRIKVTIDWKLKTDANRKTLLQVKTEGMAGSLLTDSNGPQALNEAIVNAAEQLFSDSSFIDKITRQSKQVNTMAPFVETSPSRIQGIVRPRDREVEKLFLLVENEAWKNLKSGQKIGLYAYGPNCIPYKEKRWPQAINEHPGLFPNVNEVLNAEAKVLKSLDYRYQSSDQYSVIKHKRKFGGYSLHAGILELRYDSCAPSIRDRDVLNSKSKISSTSFKRHRANLKIRWQLSGSIHEDIIFETVTQGSADSWLINTSAKNLVNKAVEQATEALFAQQVFIDKLTHKDAKQQQEEGIFSRLFSFASRKADGNLTTAINNKMILKAHLSQAFVDLAQIKVMFTQYYYERGEWPYSLGDVGLSDNDYANSKSISNISIQSDGSVIAELKDIFGTNKILQLSPDSESESSMRGLTWQCSSNLAKDFLPSNCETFN